MTRLALASALVLFASTAAAQVEPTPTTPAPTTPAPTAPPIEATTTVSTPPPEIAPAHDEKRGFEIGLRAGIGLGIGAALHSARTNEDIKLVDQGNIDVPFTLEAGFRLDPRLYLGAWGNWTWISPRKDSKSFCTEQADSCSASLMVLGAQVRFHPMPEMKFDPWISLGAGYEWAFDKATAGPVEAKSSFRGFQWMNLSVGGDYMVASRFTLGPYLSGSIGQWANYNRDVTGAGPLSVSSHGSVEDIGEKRIHSWISVGIRGAYTL